MEIKNKQLLIFFISSFVLAFGLIAHGVIFDLDFGSIQRLTYDGIFITAILSFILLIFLSKVFNMEINKRIDAMEKVKRQETSKKNNSFLFFKGILILIGILIVGCSFMLGNQVLKVLSLGIISIVVFIMLVLKGK